jgi:hypothetical protein
MHWKGAVQIRKPLCSEARTALRAWVELAIGQHLHSVQRQNDKFFFDLLSAMVWPSWQLQQLEKRIRLVVA